MSSLNDPAAFAAIGFQHGRYADPKRVRFFVGGVLLIVNIISGLMDIDFHQWWWSGWINGLDKLWNSGFGINLVSQPGTYVLTVDLVTSYSRLMELDFTIHKN